MCSCVFLLQSSLRVPSFTGFVVAKLPFVPFSLIQKLSHRNLEGDDPTDCSMVGARYCAVIFVPLAHQSPDLMRRDRSDLQRVKCGNEIWCTLFSILKI